MFAASKTAGAVSAEVNYIESCFSTYLYTGNGSTQTITNGIDLSGKGGMVWVKNRASATYPNNTVFDTARGAGAGLITNSTAAQDTSYTQSFSSTGFDLGGDNGTNQSGITYASWTFRKQPKFFDVVTWSGNTSSSNRRIAHNLQATPAFIIIKNTTNADNWYVYTASTGTNGLLLLNTTDAVSTGGNPWSTVAPTSTDFGYNENAIGNSGNWVGYLFASNAGGFGLTGTDNVISCGSFTTNGSGNFSVTLGYEPQWLLIKKSSSTSSWYMIDNMRGLTVNGQTDNWLYADTANAETSGDLVGINATGFDSTSGNLAFSQTYIYIAIRRGPMKVPTSGTSVFSPIAYAGNDVSNRIISGLINSPDLGLFTSRNAAGQANHITGSRLQGGGRYMLTESTSSESSSTAYGIQTYGQTSVTLGTAITNEQNALGINYILYAWQRAPSFFDEVCYTGTGSARTVAHNLGVAPELIFIKCRSAANQGLVYNKTITAEKFLTLFSTSEGAYAAQGPDSGPFNSTEPTSSVFSVGTYNNTNGSGATYVAYLFATCAGVSKVGTYTGTGTTLQIDCGFTAGARFVLIKRTSYPASGNVAGGWYVWDSARGIVSGNDPYLLLNTTDAEVTNTDYIDTYNAGFEISSTAPIQINESGKTYIFLAIA